VKVLQADLKTDEGQQALHRELARTDVLLTSFRPPRSRSWAGLEATARATPSLSQVAIVGAPGARAEEPGTTSPTSPTTDWCRAGAARHAVRRHERLAAGREAVLQAALRKHERYAGGGDPHPEGLYLEVALSDARRTWPCRAAGA
jgi:hypothetical protein